MAEDKKAPEAAEKGPQEKKGPEKALEVKKAEKIRPANCVGCNKAFKHRNWYYKNGRYFCTKRCWIKFAAEKKKQEAEKAAKEAEKKEAAQKAAAASAAEKAPAGGDEPEKDKTAEPSS